MALDVRGVTATPPVASDVATSDGEVASSGWKAVGEATAELPAKWQAAGAGTKEGWSGTGWEEGYWHREGGVQVVGLGLGKVSE